MLLLSRRLHHARVGEDDRLVFVTACLTVDHDTVEHTRVQVFLLHVDVRPRDTVIEDALGDLEFRTLLLHRDQQLVEREVGFWIDHILEEIGDAGNQTHDDDQGAEGLHQGDACSLDGRQLGTLTQVSENDQRTQQDSEG